MKKTLLVILAVLCGLSAMAQDEKAIKTRRPKYVNLGYVLQQDVTLETGEVLKPEFGATLNRGRTYYLHKRPIAKFLSFGIDATWIDLNYAMYKPHKFMTYDETSLHQAEIAMQVGPSITLTPAKRLQLHLYGRFAPTFALRYVDKKVGAKINSVRGSPVKWFTTSAMPVVPQLISSAGSRNTFTVKAYNTLPSRTSNAETSRRLFLSKYPIPILPFYKKHVCQDFP